MTHTSYGCSERVAREACSPFREADVKEVVFVPSFPQHLRHLVSDRLCPALPVAPYPHMQLVAVHRRMTCRTAVSV